MINSCPQCGAVQTKDRTCQSVFDEFLTLEYANPEYGVVHMLTVACYMIQHGRYTHEGLVWIEKKLRDHLFAGVSTEQIRAQAARETGQDQRGWRVTRREGDPPQAWVAWSMTILDVARQYQDAPGYRQLIEKWARTTLQEMQPLLD